MDLNALRPWFEIAYFASGIVLAGVALAGLVQIVIAKRQLVATHRQIEVAGKALEIAKNDLAVRSRREAVVLAAQRCELFASQVIPSIRKRFEAIKEAHIGLHHWRLNNSKFDETTLEDSATAQAWVRSLLDTKSALQAASDLANELEAFAMYFAKGAADEEVAYPVVGEVFCEFVNVLAPYLTAVRHNRVPGIRSGAFYNVVELYACWTERTKKSHLERRANQSRAEADRIEGELAALQETRIPPIGTED